jgi:hypothetical protein
VEGLTFRPTLLQLAITVGVAALLGAGGAYALIRSEWYSGGVVWMAAAGVLLLMAVSTLFDRTRLDADGISVRRFLVYRVRLCWALVDAVEEAEPWPHQRGRAIVVSTLIGQNITLPAPVHLPALPDRRFSRKADTLAAFARAAAAEDHRPAPRPKYDFVHTELQPARSRIVSRGVPQAVLAIVAIIGVAVLLYGLYDNLRAAAQFNAAPPCVAGTIAPPPNSSDPWCLADPMTVDGLLSDENDGPYGFAVIEPGQAEYVLKPGQAMIGPQQGRFGPGPFFDGAPPSKPLNPWIAFVVLSPNAPILLEVIANDYAMVSPNPPTLSEVTTNDTVRDVVVEGETVGAFTYHGQRIQTDDSPLLFVTGSEEMLEVSGSLAVLCTWLFFLRSGEPRSTAVRAALAGIYGFVFVSMWFTSGNLLDNRGIAVLPFFALAIGLPRLVWVGDPFVRPYPADRPGSRLWGRDGRMSEPSPDLLPIEARALA